MGWLFQALKKLKAVCVRVAAGPCLIEASAVALLSHLLMGLPWIWGFILGFGCGYYTHTHTHTLKFK